MSKTVTFTYQSLFFNVEYWPIPKGQGRRVGIILHSDNQQNIATELVALEKGVPFSFWFEEKNMGEAPHLTTDLASAIGQVIELNERV